MSLFPAALLLVLPAASWAQGDPASRPAGVQGAPSKITAVTVYQTNALVTREVETPKGAGVFELVVGPLPASTVASSLYSEGPDGATGIRVLTTRYRTWVMQENVQDEVRRLDQQIKDIERENQSLQQQISTAQQNMALMGKMEEFTSGALKQMTEKGQLNAESVTKIAEFIMTTRAGRAAEAVSLQQKIAANNEKAQYLQRERGKIAAGSDKTVREAVIVIDKAREGAGTVKLNYIVSAANWRPRYKLRAASGEGKTGVSLEYLAAINQQSGEDWKEVELALSTAEPLLNAAPPELAVLEVGTGARGATPNIIVNGTLALNPRSGDNRKEQARWQQEGQRQFNLNNSGDANKFFNDAAAIAQADEIVNADQQVTYSVQAKAATPAFREGQSVTFRLERKHSVPWRDDEQLIEVARLALKPDYFYKAVPVLTTHVYRLANLVNDSKYVILPGEATMYLGADFVGRASLPLVAIGEQFTAGFGVDPQLQVQRVMVDKANTTQGGNQVHRFDYRLSISSYKGEAAKVQLWDRLPHSATEQVNVTLVETKPELSKDAAYVRDEKPRNLLRWDLEVQPGQNGEKAAVVTYTYKMEFAKEAAIGNFITR
jgi:hypothetical protein